MQQQFRFDPRGLGALALALLAVTWPCASDAAALGQQAKDPPSAPAPTAPGTAAADSEAKPPSDEAEDEEEDLTVDPVQPDFTLATLPTTVRLPRYKLGFAVVHRFTRPINQGSVGDSLADFLGIDSGAQIGLQLRFAPIKGGQIGFHRTNEKVIELFGQYDLFHETAKMPLGINPWFSLEGGDNFQEHYSPTIGVIASRTLGRWGAVYAQPMWVNNTNPLPAELLDDNSTFMLGVGARIRIRPTVYLVGEVVPRLSGFTPGSDHLSFGIEKRAGGHMFQFNVSNDFATTPAAIARGALTKSNWYLGFNITRKFY